MAEPKTPGAEMRAGGPAEDEGSAPEPVAVDQSPESTGDQPPTDPVLSDAELAGIVDLGEVDRAAKAESAPAEAPTREPAAKKPLLEEVLFEQVQLTPVDENSPPFTPPEPRRRRKLGRGAAAEEPPGQAELARAAEGVEEGTAETPAEASAAPAAAPPAGPRERFVSAAHALRKRVRELPVRTAKLGAALRERLAGLRRVRRAAGQAAAPEEQAPAARRLKLPLQGKLMPTFLIVNTALLAAMLGTEAVATAAALRASPAEAATVKEVPPGPILQLPRCIVHLRDAPRPPPEEDAEAEAEPDRTEPTPRFARISFALELPDAARMEAATQRIAGIREAFLSYLSDRTAEELQGTEAMARVKLALVAKLSEAVPDAQVRSVYVTEIVLQ